jgi:hypothetical protein
LEIIDKLQIKIEELDKNLQAAGDWPYPITLSEAWQTAANKYSSRLIFDEERIEKGLSIFSAHKNPKIIAEAVKMLHSLAMILHPMKYRVKNFSEELFLAEAGIELSMTESRATKRDKTMDEHRICHYKGREIFCYPHLKSSVGSFPLRLHFQFIDDEEKIIIGHLGGHLPNAMSKYRK